MKTLLKIIAILVGLTVVIATAAAFVIPRYFDPNEYKEFIVTEVEKRTGRKFNIKGDIALSLFPRLGVELEGMSLGGRPGSKEPLLETGRVTIHGKLLPLLRRELQLDKATFEDTILHLEPGTTIAGDIALLGAVTYDLAGQRLQPQPFILEALLEDETSPEGPAKVTLSADLAADPQAGQAELSKLSLTGLGVAITGDLRLTDLQTGTPTLYAPLAFVVTDMDKLLKTTRREELQGVLQGLTGDVVIAGQGNLLQLNPLNLNATLAGQTLPQGPEKFALSGTTELDLDRKTLAFTELSLQGLVLDMTGTMQVDNIFDEPDFSGTLKAAPFNPRTPLSRLGREPTAMADQSALTRATIDTRFTGTRNDISFQGLTMDIDATRIEGDLAMENFSDPVTRFDLRIDAIDADRYLPPRTEDSPLIPPLPEAALGAVAALPLNLQRGLKAAGKLKIGQLRASNVTLNHLDLTVGAKDGVIRLHPVEAKLYQGTYQADISLDANGQQPKLSSDSSLRHIQIEPLLQDLVGESRLTGSADVTANLSASGSRPAAMLNSLNGEVRISILDGSYNNSRLAYFLGQASKILPTQPLKAAERRGGIDFSEIQGTLTVANGVISNQDLFGQSTLALVEGAGIIDPIAKTVDYEAIASLTEAAIDPNSDEFTAADDYSVPIHIHGAFGELTFQPDFSDLARAKIKSELEKRNIKLGENLEKRLQEKLGIDAGKLLNNLLKF